MSTELTETFAEVGTPTNPFPGLRPFEFEESHLFFGRDGQSEQLISKLGRTRFLAVVGTSGSGKSSLVRAGFLPTLLGGFMASAGSGWRIAIMRPGNNPIGNLAQALNAPDVFGSEIEENAAVQIAIAEAILRRGSLGLVDAVRQATMPENENLIVVVDQFEEIFRFARVAASEAYGNEAAAFVKLILEATCQREIPIYVVLTMRSDYLGDCSKFWGLPEAINESQYLIPRLTRDQLREAITGPVAVGRGRIAPRLVNRLLNDVGDNQDQLPVLQHLLMRAWSECKEKRLDVEVNVGASTVRRPHKELHEGEAIDLCCYDAVGGIAEALSRHADEAFNELPDDRHREVTEKLFKALTEKGPDNREIRRPITLGEISTVVNATTPQVITVIDAFRHPRRSFLMPPADNELNMASLIDISHESLIRGWERLRNWVDEEARSARIYRRLAETAELHREGKAGLWGDPDLPLALDWQAKNNPNKDWARRYHPEFAIAMTFLDKSVAARQAEEMEREQQRRQKTTHKRTRLIATFLGFSFVISLAALVFANTQRVKANEEQVKANEERVKANDALSELISQTALTQEQRDLADLAEKARAKAVEELNASRLRETELMVSLLDSQAKQARQEAYLAHAINSLNREANDEWEKGNVAGAIEKVIQAVDYYRRRADHRGEHDSLTLLGSAYLKLGEYAKAQTVAKQALEIGRKVAQRGEHENLSVLRDAASGQGDIPGAEGFGERALQTQESSFGLESPMLIPDLKSLALLKDSRGQRPQAESFRLRIISIQRGVLHAQSREVAASLDELATAYRAQGDYAKAESRLKEELAIQRNALGVDDPEVIRTLNALASLYRYQTKDAEADLLVGQVQAIQGEATLLRKGTSGPEVQKLQVRLGELGFYRGTHDGYFGASTEISLVEFQRSKGLVADGIASQGTLQALEERNPTTTNPASTYSITGLVTVELVSEMFPGVPVENIKTTLPFILKALEDQGLTDKGMVLMVLATLGVESLRFMPTSELQSRFNTSPGGRPFDLYDNRSAIGNEGPPDGERFRGRGYLQVAGRRNYSHYSAAIGLGTQLLDNPDLASRPEIAARILVRFLKDRESRIRRALSSGDLAALRRVVNGGTSGLAEFTKAFRTGESLFQ